MAMLKGMYILNQDAYGWIYPQAIREAIGRLIDCQRDCYSQDAILKDPGLLKDVDVIFSGWGCPIFTRELLAAAPRLKAVFYGAGSIKYFVTDAFWERGIAVTSGYIANDIPVVMVTLAQILFCLKRGWQYAIQYRQERHPLRLQAPGTYGATIGIVSLGAIGRMVVEALRPFDFKVIAYDPFVKSEDGGTLVVEMVSLDEVFRRSDVVSLHTPWLKETEGLITGAHLASMKPNSTFINTARGAVVRETEMLDVLARRPDLFAVLDVTYPEPPDPDSPLFTLPNVLLTPHIAGPIEGECARNGQFMLEELQRYLAGEPMKYAISRERAAIMA
jgi:phosphoglycerate dehydrogenase-like enzyme